MPDVPRWTGWVSATAVTAGTTVGLLAGALGWRPVCAAALTFAVLAETPMQLGNQRATKLLRTAGLGLSVRTALRLTAVVAVSRADATSAQVTAATVLTGAALLAMLAVANMARLRLGRRRTPAIETRNVPLDGLNVPPALPEVLIKGDSWPRAALELPLLLGACLATTSTPIWGLGALSVAGTLLLAISMEHASRSVAERLGAPSMIPLVQGLLDRQRTEVLLYFSDSLPSIYQVQMWLSTIERLGRPAAVVLRDRAVLRALGPTSLPLLCIPSAPDLMALDLRHVRVGLFPANVGSNIHLLREPGLTSVFIGHGDSDKNASFNPVSRSFDEVWVAGAAGRERYRRADIGVRDAQIVEVGRPQLDGVQQSVERPPGWVPTILYAPTWEGWNSDQEYGSLLSIGPRLVRAVLEHPSRVRLVYKPHPFTGRRDPRVAATHRRIVSMMDAANAELGLLVPTLGGAVERRTDQRRDPAERAAALGSHQGPSATEAEEQASRADAALFAGLPAAAHLVVGAGGPSLFSCFDITDVLVTDISSVLTDFIVSGKPFAVCNPSALGEAEFVRSFPSAAAGMVVDSEGDGLVTVLGVAVGALTDPNADRRREQARYLVGAEEGSATERFADAVDAAARRAAERNASRQFTVHSESEPSAEALVSPEGRDWAPWPPDSPVTTTREDAL